MALFAQAPLQRGRQPEPVPQRQRARLLDEPVRLRRILGKRERGSVKQCTNALKRTGTLRLFLRQRLTFFYHPLIYENSYERYKNVSLVHYI